jgi:predicted nucleic acid-binding protein
MIIKHVNDKLALDAFSVSLHSGEVEAMLLTRQLGADLLIMDDGLARKYAKRLNITITGTVGVILQAKNKGIIPRVKPILDDMISNGFYLSEQIRRDILIVANE